MDIPTEHRSSSDSGVPDDRIGGRDGLALLLRRFDACVRQHRLIGPIFNRTVKDRPSHLETIADLWSNVTGGPVLCSGPTPFRHVRLGLDLSHFDAWLDLWQRHCRAHLRSDAAEDPISAAETRGERIRFVIAAHGTGRDVAAHDGGRDHERP